MFPAQIPRFWPQTEITSLHSCFRQGQEHSLIPYPEMPSNTWSKRFQIEITLLPCVSAKANLGCQGSAMPNLRCPCVNAVSHCPDVSLPTQIHYFYFKTKMTGFFQTCFYFGYTSMACVGLTTM